MVKFKWNLQAFRDLRNSPGVIADLERRANAIAAAANGADRNAEGEPDGYVAAAGPGKNRGRATVVTATAPAMADNARHQTLIRALDAGRG